MGVDEHIGRLAFQYHVINTEVHLLYFLQALFVGAPHVNGSRVHQHAPGAVVQLQAAAAGHIGVLDKLPIGLSHILNEFFIIGIVLPGVPQGKRHYHLGQELGRCGNGKLGFHAFAGQVLYKAEVFQERMASFVRQFADEIGVVHHGLLSVEGEAGFGGLVPHAVKAPHKVQVPGLATELSVGNNLEAQVHLLVYKIPDGFIFHGLQLGRCNLACSSFLAGFFNGFGAEKTADKVGPHGGSVHHIFFFVSFGA